MIELCGIKMYSPKELKEMTGLGKNKIYELLNDHYSIGILINRW